MSSPSAGRAPLRRSCAPALETRTYRRTTGRHALSRRARARRSCPYRRVAPRRRARDGGSTPPLRLLLAPVVVEQLREQPTRVTLSSPLKQLVTYPLTLRKALRGF